jgi:TonB family protein
MPSKKILILSVAISLLAHALLISATGLLERRQGKPMQEATMNVNLQEAQKIQAGLTARDLKAPESPASPPVEVTEGDVLEQETIALDSEDEKFAPYLKKIKQRIEKIWSYPPEAFAEKKEGVSTVAFSLDRRGRLVGSKIVESSGYEVLDQGTINVINAAAPYAPFPRSINLSRLHIQATFRYRLLE